jgi:hypothetical protein
VHLVTKKR